MDALREQEKKDEGMQKENFILAEVFFLIHCKMEILN